MTASLRILLLAHGYPPRETAGTEEHTHQLANALESRGHDVHVIAATRAPGRAQYAVIEEPGITRIVNNIAARTLAQCERDDSIDAIITQLENRLQPQVVHIHHTQFLSSSLRFAAPTVVTLHDAWAWCASGGLLLRPDASPCPGPEPETCARCHQAWRPAPSRTAQGLTATAGWLAPVIAPDRLHRWYRMLPSWMRPAAVRGDAPVESAATARARNEAVGAQYRGAALRIAPSRWLAQQAEAEGLGPVEVVPHGIPVDFIRADPQVRKAGPLVHLGTVSSHKGTDRVVQAWRKACPDGTPELRIHGPVLDASASLGHPVGPVLDRPQIGALLDSARALVLGARWPENAPLIILEARARGCPVIAPAVGGIPEILRDGVDGILVPAGDDDALAAAIASVTTSPLPVPSAPPALSTAVDAIEAIYRRVATPKPTEAQA